MPTKLRKTRYPHISALLLVLSLGLAVSSSADVVIDWNRNALNAIRVGGGNRVFTSRSAAIVHAAVFNAVNGIEGRYAPYDPHSSLPDVPAAGASKRAAAVQAGYATLLKLFPAQAADFKAERAASLAAIESEESDDDAITRGIDWGNKVADHVWALRIGDNLSSSDPSFPYRSEIGDWQKTLPALAPASTPQLGSFTPWVDGSVATIPAPPALTSRQYAADFNETRTTGRGIRFPDLPLTPSPYITTLPTSSAKQRIAVFWNGDTALFWNRIAEQVSESAHLSLSQNARLFALLNIAMADAAIACWKAKYEFQFWRPITAIPLAESDANPETSPDPSWTPYLVVTPAHPEYPSGHSTVSGAAVAVLGRLLGDKRSFSVDSETLPGVIRSFKRFSDALAEIHDARVWGGIHFRSACREGSVMGQAVGELVLKAALRPLHGDDDGPRAAPEEERR